MPTTAIPAPVRWRRWALPLLVLTALLIVTALGGCARVRAALAVQPDDSVNGEIVLATPLAGPDDRGPRVTVPPRLGGAVTVTDYRQDGYTGSLLRFSGLTFEQTSALIAAAGPEGRRVALGLRRTGGRVLVTGRVDLTTIPVDRADFQLKISFPGQVVETNGDTNAGTVSWKFTAGTVGDINAVVAYADPNAPSVTGWTVGLGSVVALVCAVVVLLARRYRTDPPGPSPRRPTNSTVAVDRFSE